jgi:aspartyl-tRNA(Asn)/glutamyl-tRNA(Gln) amidotransferase subunit A
MSAPDLRTIEEVSVGIRAGAISPVDLVDACLARIEARQAINAYITVLGERARADARRAASEIASGTWRGPLHGIPIAVKDLIDVVGSRTTSGSALPAAEASMDAPVVARLREAGAIILGKTNLHEFAFGTTSDETAYGAVRHPRDTAYSAGGSSGGSAAALADGMAFGALGTDTGGSVRIPSAVCGTVGLKPGFEEVPCDGVVPLSVSFDHVGPMARSVGDVALLYDVLADVPRGTPEERAPARARFGVPRRYFCEVLEDGVRDALERAVAALREAGHEVADVEIEDAAWTPHVYLHVVLPEASWYHAPLLERHASSYSPGVRLRLEMGRSVLAEDYVRAMNLRPLLRNRVDRALEACDALLLPALAIPAPPLGAATFPIGGQPEPIRALMLRLTQLFNITGHPALAIPAAAAADGWPRGIQLVGRRGRTRALLQLGADVALQISGGPGSVGGGTG